MVVVQKHSLSLIKYLVKGLIDSIEKQRNEKANFK